MIIDEFDNYFRICLNRTLSSAEAKQLLLVVDDIAEVEPEDDDTVMVYHMDDNDGNGYPHCYDIRLASSIGAEQGDQLLASLEEIFPDDDFDCESSMDTVSEQTLLNDLTLEQLTKII